jgi:hypothetical protein
MNINLKQEVKQTGIVIWYMIKTKKVKHIHPVCTAGVEITTRQLAKCKWNLELASNFLNLLASLANVIFLPHSESFFPAN